MDTQTALTKIEELVKVYTETSNRQALSILRQMVTKITRKNPCLEFRLQDIFEKYQLSMDTL